MGNPKDPRRPETATATKDRPTGKKEVHRGQKAEFIEGYRRKAEAVSTDKDVRAAEAIRDLRGNLAPDATPKQEDGLTALNTAIVIVLTKLAKDGVDISKIGNTKELKDKINSYKDKYDIEKLPLPEEAAVQNLNRIASESGLTATEVKNSWNDRREAAHRAHKGYYKYYREKYPVATPIAVMLGSAGVVYLGYRAYQALFGEESSKESSSKTEKSKKKSWFKKEVMLPIILLLLGGSGLYLGKDEINKIMKKYGLTDVKDKVKKGKKLSKKTQDNAKKAGKEIEAANKRAKAGLPPVAAEDDYEEPEPGTLQTEADVRRRKKNAKEKVRKVAERFKTPEGKFKIASLLFVNVFFFERGFKGKAKKNELRYALNTMREKKIRISRIKAAVEKYKAKKRIPKGEFPELTQNFSDAQRFLLMKKLVAFSKLAGKLKGDPNIEKVFIAIANNPSYQINNVFHGNIVEKMKSGEFLDVFTGMDYDKMNQEVTQKVKDGSIRIVESINEKLDPELKRRFEALSKEDKKQVHAAQVALITGANIRIPAEEAVTLAIKESGDKIKDPEVKKLLVDFFESMKSKTEKILPKAKKRFSIKEVGGKKLKVDFMHEGVKFKNLSFLHCVEIIVASEGVDLDAEGDEEQWMQDMALLTVLLRAMDDKNRRIYLTHLGTKVIEDDLPDINVPGLKNLAPYFDGLVGLGRDFIAEYALKRGTALTAWAAARPDIGSEAFRERLRKSPKITLGKEVGGSYVEMGRDAFAFLFSVGGIDPDDFGNVETGEDFLSLLMSNPNTQQIVYDREHPSLMAIQIAGKWIFVKPFGILKESLSQLGQSPGTALGTWVVGSAPIMGLYGAKEFFTVIGRSSGGTVQRARLWKVGRILRESAKGLKYPLWPVKMTKRGVEAAIHATQTVGETVTRGRQALNWTRDVIGKRTLTQNVGNMLESGKWMKHYAKNCGDLTDRTWRELLHQLKTDKINLLKRTFGSTFNRRMALRHSIRFSKQYNHFFDFRKGHKLMLSIEPFKQLEGIESAVANASSRFDRLRLFTADATKNKKLASELLEVTKMGLKGDDLPDAMAKVLKKIGHLEADEFMALAKQLRSEDDIAKFTTRLGEGVKYFAGTAKPRSGKSPLKERFRPLTETEAGRSFGKVKQALNQTERNLARTQKSLASAEKEISRLTRRLSKSPKDAAALERRLAAARQVLADARAAEQQIKVHKHALQWVREAEAELELLSDAKLIAQKEAEIRNATKLAESTLNESSKATKGVIESLRLSKGIKSRAGLKFLEILRIANNEAIVLETTAKFGKIAKRAKNAKDAATALAKTPEAIKAINNVTKRAKDVGKAVDALEAAKKPFWRLRSASRARVAKAAAKLKEAEKAAKAAKDAAKALTAGKDAAKAIEKAAKAAQKSAEVLATMQKARKTAKATKNVVVAARKGFLTTAEALKLGTKIETIASKGGKFMKFARIGGRAFIVLDAVISVYDVYDQSCELGKVLSNEYVETGSILAAMDKISKLTDKHAEAQRSKEDKANQEILNQKNIKKKLRGARDLAVKLKAHASSYGISRRTKSGDSTFDKIWSAGGSVLSELTLTPTIMRTIYGGRGGKLQEAEDMLIRTNAKQGREILTQLYAIEDRTDEIRKTIDALAAAINLAKKAMKEDEPASDSEIDELGKKIRQAQAAR